MYQRQQRRIPRRSAAGKAIGPGDVGVGVVDGADSDSCSSSDDEHDAPGVADPWGLLDAPYKMLLCVNMDLKDAAGKSAKMKPGKMAAQCCHAVLGAHKRAARRTPAALKSAGRRRRFSFRAGTRIPACPVGGGRRPARPRSASRCSTPSRSTSSCTEQPGDCSATTRPSTRDHTRAIIAESALQWWRCSTSRACRTRAPAGIEAGDEAVGRSVVGASRAPR